MIKRIEVNVPSNFELLTCEDFGGDNVLEEGEPGLEALNERIKKDYGTPSDYSIYCDYKIVRPKVNPGEFDEIQVSVTYDYRVDIKKTVNVVGLRSAYPDQMVYGEEEEDDGYEEVGGVYSYTE